MLRPLLEIWRELNRDHDRLSLLKLMEREPPSLKHTLANLNREPSPTLKQALANLNRELSPTLKQTLADIENYAAPRVGREWREKLSRLQEEYGVAERVLGKPRPIPPPQPDKPAQPGKHDIGITRKPGVGRPRSLTPARIEKGIGILRKQPKMTLDAACATLEAEGIKASRSAVYRLVFKPAYASR